VLQVLQQVVDHGSEQGRRIGVRAGNRVELAPPATGGQRDYRAASVIPKPMII